MKESIIKYISIAVVFLAVIIAASVLLSGVSGCAHFPEKDDMTDECPPSCLDYQRCLYYSAKSKVKFDCSSIYDRCSKDRVFFECAKELPEGVNFQQCWDKKR
jgi:hypothetical protein